MIAVICQNFWVSDARHPSEVAGTRNATGAASWKGSNLFQASLYLSLFCVLRHLTQPCGTTTTMDQPLPITWLLLSANVWRQTETFDLRMPCYKRSMKFILHRCQRKKPASQQILDKITRNWRELSSIKPTQKMTSLRNVGNKMRKGNEVKYNL